MKRHIVRSCRRGVAFLLAAVMCLTMAAGATPEPEQLEQPEQVEQLEQTQPSTTIQEIDALTETLNAASVSGLVVPVTGATPVAAEALTVADGSKYALTSISWADAEGTPVSGSFAAETVYTATVVLTAAEGCKFQAMTPTVDAGTAAAGTISGDAEQNTLTFTVTFTAAAAEGGLVEVKEIIQDTDAEKVTFATDKPWSTWTSPDGSTHFSDTEGSSVTVRFTGTQIAVYGQPTTNGTVMTSAVDTVAGTNADFHTPLDAQPYNVKIWESEKLEQGDHTLVLTLGKGGTNPNGVRAVINYFEVTTLGEAPPPEIPATPPTEPLSLWYTEPGADFMQQGVPIGNGYMGALITGGLTQEKIQFNEETLWTGGPGSTAGYENNGTTAPYNFGLSANPGGGNGKQTIDTLLKKLQDGSYDDAVALMNSSMVGNANGYGAYQNFGYLTLDHGISGATAYSRGLNLAEGTAWVSYQADGVTYTREYFASYPDHVMGVKLSASENGKISVDVSAESAQPDAVNASITAVGDTVTMKGALKDNGMRYEAQFKVIPTSGTMSAAGDTVTVANADSVVILFTAATDYKNEFKGFESSTYRSDVDPHVPVSAGIAAAAAKGYDALLAAHQADYKELFERVELNLDGQNETLPTDQLIDDYKLNSDTAQGRMLETLLYQYGRYMLISSSRQGTLPANLQGKWNAMNNPPWSSDYHFNINLQMNYWPAESANLAECVSPLVDFVSSLQESGAQTAKAYFGEDTEGWTVHCYSNIFGLTAPGWTWTWGWSPASNAFICQNLWDYYQFTGDQAYLESDIYPLMKSAAEFWKSVLREDKDGTLVAAPGYSPEHGPLSYGIAYDQQLVWELFTNVIEASEILGTDEPLRTELTALRAKLSPVEVGTHGQIMEWKDNPTGEGAGIEPGHRHVSNLVGFYPGTQINRNTQEWFDAAKVTLNRRGDDAQGWSMGWKINFWARALDGDRAHKLINNLLNINVFDNLFDTHLPQGFQIDGNFGYTAGVNEMLVQSHLDSVDLLPALPTDWSDGSVSGIRARGGYTVGLRWADGEMTRATVTPDNAGPCKVRATIFRTNEAAISANGANVEFTRDGEFLTFTAEADKTYTIVPGPARAAEVLTAAGITGLTAPAKGATPVKMDALHAGDSAKYTVTSLTWADESGKAPVGVFMGTTVYKATVILTAGKGYQFQALTPTVNAGTAAEGSVSAAQEQNTLTFVVTFPATGDTSIGSVPSGGKVENTDPAVLLDQGGGADWSSWEHLSYTTKVGATAILTFRGTGITLYGQKASNGPIMSVTIDGVDAGDADFYNVGTQSSVKIFERLNLDDKEHTIVLTFTDRKNAAAKPIQANMQAAIDYFDVTGPDSPDPDAPVAYVKNYEDGKPGTWAGATATIEEEVGNTSNHVLKLVMNGFAVDNAAPKLENGTLSMRVKTDKYSNFGFLYRARATANTDNQANQLVNSPDTWFVCNEGSFNVGYPVYPNGKNLKPTANEWVEVKLQFNGDDVEIALDDVRYGVFTKAGLSNEAGVFGLRVWGSSRTVYVDDVTFTADMLPMGEEYEPPVVEVPRVKLAEDYATATPNWDGGVDSGNTVTVTVPANGVALNQNAPDLTHGLYTWRLKTDSTGGIGVAFSATPEGFNALYTAGDGSYTLRLADGSTKPFATGLPSFSANTLVKVQVIRVGDVCSLYINGVEIGSVTETGLSSSAGKVGLYNPGSAPAAVEVSASEVYELFFYENDFSDETKLGGWTGGTPTKTEDGKLKLSLKAVSNIIAMDTPIITDGVYEFDLTDDAATANGRLGFLFRCLNEDYQSMFYDTGSTWFWLNGSAYGGVSVGQSLDAGEEYHVKLTVRGSSVLLELNGREIFADTVSALNSAQGRFGLRKQYHNTTVTLDNLVISELCAIAPDDVAEVPETITGAEGGLTVTMDKAFPRVIKYEMNSKTLTGNPEKTYGLVLNGNTYYPMVSASKSSADTLRYELYVPAVQVKVTMTYQVVGKELRMKVTGIEEKGDFKVNSLGFADAVLASTTAGAADASHASVETLGGWFQVRDVIYDDMAAIPKGDLGSAGRGYVMLSSNGLAATVNNSGIEAAGKITARLYKTQQGNVGTFGDGAFTYRTPLDTQKGTTHPIWSTVTICEDYNSDGEVSWQDAAANYRNIRTELYGTDTIKNSMMYITMNFASQVQQPFLRTLDLGKTIYNYTDGFGQLVMHKGFAAEGHDDSHGDYGGHVGVRQGGAEDFNYIMEEGADYNIKYGIHINVSEHNPDGFYFNPDAMTRPLGANWGWIDQAYWVDERKDILTGNRNENLDRLKASLPNLAFTYIDIYANSTWMAEDLVKNLNKRGFIAGTEFGGAMEMGAAFTHWGHDRAYPFHGNNSTILRYVKSDADVFVPNKLFNTSIMPLVGSWGNTNDISDASNAFFNNTLPSKYLQHFAVLDVEDTYVTFSDGVKTEVKGQKVELTKDGKLLAVWDWVALSPADHSWAASDTKDALVFIPWFGENSETKNPSDADKIYHWNPKGGESTWDVPGAWTTKGITAADVYQLSGDAKTKIGTVDVLNGKITITADAETGYVLYPANSPAPRVAGGFGSGSGMVNPGFEDTDLGGWTVDVKEGGAAAVVKDAKTWETRLAMTGAAKAEVSVSQTITGLEGGKSYTAYLMANVGETGRLDVSIKAGDATVTATALPTRVRQYDLSKYFPERDLDGVVVSPPYDNYQKVRVVFTVPQGGNSALLTLKGLPGGSTVYADDVTLFDALVENPAVAGVGDYKDYVVYEDFENVEQGLGVFQMSYLSGLYTHLAEYNADMEQFRDYVVSGNFSLKTNEFGTGANTETLRTRTSEVKLTPNTTYEIGFKYETGTDLLYELAVKRPDGTKVYSKLLPITELFGEGASVTETFTTGDYDDCYLAIIQNSDPLKAPAPANKPEGSTMEYMYLSLDNVYLKRIVGDSITALQAVSTGTYAGVAPVLPTKVKATFTDGHEAYLSVVWDEVAPSDYAQAGTVTVSGTVAGTLRKAQCTLRVTARAESIDAADLEALIAYAEEEKAAAGYAKLIPTVKTAFDTALTAAQNADEAQRENAYYTLLSRVHLLDYTGDKTALSALYAANKDKVKGESTDAAWAAFGLALQRAKTALDGEIVLQAEYDLLHAQLTAAAAALVGPIDPTPDPAPNPGTGNTTTKTETNPDGSKTTTVTNKKTGTVTVTTKYPDGKQIQSISEKDGAKTFTVTDKTGAKAVEIKIPAQISAPEIPFTDVPENHWARAAVDEVTGLGLFVGTGNGVFSGELPLSRGTLATVLHRFAGKLPGGEVPFTDVSADAWYAPATAWAAKTGIIQGIADGIFAPDASLTRESTALMLYRFASLLGMDTTAKEGSLASFADSDKVSAWSLDAMRWATSEGIMQGAGGMLRPTDTLSRAEAAVLMARFIALIQGK